MKDHRSRVFSIVLVCLIVAAPTAIRADSVGAAAAKLLAQARRATVQYHDVNQAIADGYVFVGASPEHGIEYVNFGLVDCSFEPTRPETIRYFARPDGSLQLAGVEYVVPMACTSTPPEGFPGDADEWEPEEDLPLWILGAWIWVANPGGVFADLGGV
jgi:hypothetical protein